LSKETSIPLGYFFLQEPPIEKLDILEYRTMDSIELQNPSRNLVDNIYEMQSVQEWMHEYMKQEQNDKLKFVGALSGRNDSREIANIIRSELELDIDWYKSSTNTWESFKELRNRFEESGISYDEWSGKAEHP